MFAVHFQPNIRNISDICVALDIENLYCSQCRKRVRSVGFGRQGLFATASYFHIFGSEENQMTMQVTEINIYPIKSTAKITLPSVEVESTGLQWDRRWMLTDHNFQFITGRKYPKLTQIYSFLHDSSLRVSFQHETIEIPFDAQGKEVVATVWKDAVKSIHLQQYDAWFSQWLEQNCHLIYMQNLQSRTTSPHPTMSSALSFADSSPLLLTNLASLHDLNSHLSVPVTMDHFRPNIVISGESAYEEDQWKIIQIGSITFSVISPCRRCVFTTVDPNRGIKRSDGEPLKTLHTYRQLPNRKGVYFGQNLIPHSFGKIQLGDRVILHE